MALKRAGFDVEGRTASPEMRIYWEGAAAADLVELRRHPYCELQAVA